MGWLEGDVALVTGGGSGLGRAIVERYIEEGAHVGVLERSPEKVSDLRASLGDKVVVIQGDVTSLDDNDRAVAETIARFGKLDCFVGNAGIWDFSIPLLDIPRDKLEAACDEVFNVNMKGYLFGAKASARALLETRGSMIFTLSNAAFYPGGGGAIYTASKHAGAGLVRQLAYELAPKVRVNGVAPTGMSSDLRGPRALDLQDTTLNSRLPSDVIATIMPLQFTPEPRDYTGHYVLLASRENSRTTTGALIAADNGLGIRGLRRPAGGIDL